MEFFEDFYNNNKLGKDINTAFLVLIPKKDHPTSFSDFRSISMVGAIYKILSKVLTERLKGTLHKIINESQTAFLANRQIFDGILIANETVDWLKKKKKRGIIFKVDFEKAYDSVEWNFIDYCLIRMGYGEKWRGWIKEYITTASLSVLINGSPTKRFNLQRGLRQGDPLSFFLFIIVAEGMNGLFREAFSKGILKGIKIGENGPDITLRQFADDTLIFSNGSKDEILNIKRLLRCFELTSGLKINFNKSACAGINTKRNEVSQIAKILRCKIENLPINYLGIPISGNMNRVIMWNPIIEKIEKRLASWKQRLITMAGRITLIKSVLKSLPTYFMSMFKAPKSVCKKIEEKMRNFLWGHENSNKKIHWVNWEKIIRSKEHGGLDIGSISLKNESLLAKWWWRYSENNTSLWKEVIRNKFDIVRSKWLPNETNYSSSHSDGVRLLMLQNGMTEMGRN